MKNSIRQKAIDLGADDTAIIPTDMISVEDQIVEFCKSPLCESYGNCAHCPPHAISPARMRQKLASYHRCLVFKVHAPTAILQTEAQFSVFRRVFEITAELERYARSVGFERAMGLAAGSCKSVFCKNVSCRLLESGTDCRHPSLARPSMEATGIHVFKLIQDLGWEIHRISQATNPDRVPLGTLAALLILE